MVISSRVTEITLPNGGRAAILPTNVKDVVTIYGSLIGGPSAFSGADEMAAEMAADLLDAGSGKLSKEAFRAALATRGAEVHFSANGTRLSFSASCFPEDASFVIARIADAILRPHLPAAEFAAQKMRLQADLDDEASNTTAQAEHALTRLAYPAGHPNYAPTTVEEKRRVAAATLADARAIAKHYGTAHLALAVVGDVNAARMRDTLEKTFGKTPAGKARPSVAPTTSVNHPDARRENVIIAGKANADIAIGSALGFGMDDDRYLPTLAVTHMLGSGGFSSHLMQTVRERDGLTYGVRARLKGLSDMLDGYFQIWATFAPHLLIRGTDTTLRETGTFLKGGITEESLVSVKEEITGGYAVSLSTTQGLASRLVRIMEDDKPISYIDEYPELISAITLDEALAAAAHLASLPLSIATAGSI